MQAIVILNYEIDTKKVFLYVSLGLGKLEELSQSKSTTSIVH